MAQLLVRPPITDQPRMTFEEFLAWADGQETHAEWVDGEVIEFMTVKGRNTLVFGFLFELFRSYVRLRRLGMVFSEPYAMLIRGGRSYRLPDIAVLLNAHVDRFTEDRLDGPADLVVEIISEDSVTRDRKHKRDEYAKVGIPEYWIVEGRKDRVGCELSILNPAGKYAPAAPDVHGRLHSTVLPGFWIDPTWLAADPLPDLDWVLDEIAPGIHLERAERARRERIAREQQGKASPIDGTS